jgi:hypothetical protein
MMLDLWNTLYILAFFAIPLINAVFELTPWSRLSLEAYSCPAGQEVRVKYKAHVILVVNHTLNKFNWFRIHQFFAIQLRHYLCIWDLFPAVFPIKNFICILCVPSTALCTPPLIAAIADVRWTLQIMKSVTVYVSPSWSCFSPSS